MQVKCPTCEKPSDYSVSNPVRPFCSERCQTLDLGAWADEKYRVPTEEGAVNDNSTTNSYDDGALPPKHQLN